MINACRIKYPKKENNYRKMCGEIYIKKIRVNFTVI